MRHLPIIISLFALSCNITAIYAQSQTEKEKMVKNITINSLQADLEFLASDYLEGREAGKRGAELSALYIASQFKSYGLSPFLKQEEKTLQDYIQPVPLVWEHLENTTFNIQQGNLTLPLQKEIDYQVSSANISFSLEGSIVFGGYGLNEKTLQSNSGNHQILVRGIGLPDELNDTHTKFKELTDRQLTGKKNKLAKEAGFIAVLEFDPATSAIQNIDFIAKDHAEKEMTKYSSGIYKRSVRRADAKISSDIPVFKISHRTLTRLFPNWKADLKKWTDSPQKTYDLQESSYSASMSANVESEPFTSGNVLGKIEGKNKDEIIVIGAHYDHLGIYDGYVYNGADDNASGTVGVMALAKAFTQSGIQPEKTLIFAAWTAEERGLHGSTHFVKTFEDIGKIKYYHNYDMIGRSFNPEKPDSAVSLLYTGSWDLAKTLTEQNNNQYGLGLEVRWGAMDNPAGGSDNAPFALEGIPIMWFHTGGHPDYHGPYDHVEKIDWQKLERIVKVSFLNLWDLCQEDNL